MTHVMIDLETLSSHRDAAVMQVAAVCFDPYGTGVDEAYPPFNEFVWDKHGYMSLSTIAWWMAQPHAKIMSESWKKFGKKPSEVLTDFNGWFSEVDTSVGDVKGVWSHGASFDLPVLYAMYDRTHLRSPWHYHLERDTRTIFWLAGGKPDILDEHRMEHDALSDCVYQVRQVQAAMINIRTRNLEVPL
jgi:hypothetical protein